MPVAGMNRNRSDPLRPWPESGSGRKGFSPALYKIN